MNIDIYKYQEDYQYSANWFIEYYFLERDHSYHNIPVLILRHILNWSSLSIGIIESLDYSFYYKDIGTFPDTLAPFYCAPQCVSRSSWLELLLNTQISKDYITTLYTELDRVRPQYTFQTSQVSISARFHEKPDELE